MDSYDPNMAGIGHNSQAFDITIEVRCFNSLAKYAGCDGSRRKITLPAGAKVGELAAILGIPVKEIFLALVNGRDITKGLVGATIAIEHSLSEGDIVAFSGAVPYSYGYGAPVV